MSSSAEQSNEKAEVVAPEAQPVRAALPPPDPQTQPEQGPGIFDRLVSFIEMRPVISTSAIFAVLLLVHIVIGNAAGIFSGVFEGPTIFALTSQGFIDTLVLALVAYNIVLPTFLARSCLTAFADTASALNCTDRVYDEHLTALAGAHVMVRVVFMGFWASVLTPVFGGLLQVTVPGTGSDAMMLTIWMYARLAMIFGLLGSSLSYIALLHYRFSAALGDHLRVDLFDMTPLQPLARYARSAVFYLSIMMALAGPIVARPEAATASATLLSVGALFVLLASFGALWGARRNIHAAKELALSELHAYSREIWRRAYANGRIVEAVALPAMAAMVTIRNQIARMANWPGGWTNIGHCVAIATLPVLTWFGGLIVSFLLSAIWP